jgi:hypothetical protein
MVIKDNVSHTTVAANGEMQTETTLASISRHSTLLSNNVQYNALPIMNTAANFANTIKNITAIRYSTHQCSTHRYSTHQCGSH